MKQLDEKNRILIQNLLLQGVQQLFKALQNIAQLKGGFRTGSWSNQNNLISAYLTYSPNNNPAEETIDIIFDLSIKDKIAEFSIDAAWSNGVIIAEILEQEIYYDQVENLLPEIKILIDQLIIEIPEQVKQVIEDIA